MTIAKPGRTMGPTSDLVVLAPWKPGIIGADEAILPRSRFIRTFDGIYRNRLDNRELQEISAFADPIEQIEQVHSFRIVARDDGMLLAVTYDHGWDGYMRALWGPGGPFIDLMLANCKDYVPTRSASLQQWSDWVRRHETVSDYFYAATPVTVGDIFALSQGEAQQRTAIDRIEGDRQLTGFASKPAKVIAAENRAVLGPAETGRQALRILASAYRLTRHYGADATPGAALNEDAMTLLLFTRGLLTGWSAPGAWQTPPLRPETEARFACELAWYRQPVAAGGAVHAADPPVDRANVQRGILTGFDDDAARVVAGAALFLMVEDAVAARAALAGLDLAADNGRVAVDGVLRNIAFTFQGLSRLRLPDTLLDTLPAAFVEGAAARAGRVGDMRSFHPANWQPLPRNWPPGSGGNVDIGQVDVVIQLRSRTNNGPLTAAIEAIGALPGLTLLSVEMLGPANPGKPGFDHFDVKDGISQPVVGGDGADAVPVGDMLLGYRRSTGDVVASHADLADGSFLAIRRMPMFRDRFDAMIAAAQADTNINDRSLLIAKIVGRYPNGKSLISPCSDQDFDFATDPAGSLCPRQSHIRRVNPREPDLMGNPPPRIMRRGMSFGPPWRGTGHPDAGAERGSLFMAYCADLAEQYEVVLRWVNGGNSTRIGSFLADPLCSVPFEGKPRTYRFLHKKSCPSRDGVYRFSLPAAAAAPITLSWSLYLFAPSLCFVAGLPAQPLAALPLLPHADPAQRRAAAALVERLLADGAGETAWRNVLDEPDARLSGLQRAVWAVIREDHGGVLVTPELVLVGSHAAVISVLRDDGRRFSVSGAGERIAASIEKFHLGLDAASPDYQREGPACNDALRAVPAAEAYDRARQATAGLVAASLAASIPPTRVDVVKDLLESVTAMLAPAWFGLPDGKHVMPGPSDWRDVAGRTPVFPGDFWNPSRHAFNPFESAQTRDLSRAHGQAILKAAEAWIAATGRENLTGSVARQLAAATAVVDGVTVPAYPTDHDLARGLVGAMLGWVATTLGNAARLLDQWVENGELARLQVGWRSRPGKSHADAVAHFGAAMAAGIGARPVPECKWRIVAGQGVALQGHLLNAGAKVVLGLESAAADQAGRGIVDQYIWFGMAETDPQPPHGCPGRDMAMGMLLGMIAGLAEAALARPAGSQYVMDLSPA